MCANYRGCHVQNGVAGNNLYFAFFLERFYDARNVVSRTRNMIQHTNGLKNKTKKILETYRNWIVENFYPITKTMNDYCISTILLAPAIASKKKGRKKSNWFPIMCCSTLIAPDCGLLQMTRLNHTELQTAVDSKMYTTVSVTPNVDPFKISNVRKRLQYTSLQRLTERWIRWTGFTGKRKRKFIHDIDCQRRYFSNKNININRGTLSRSSQLNAMLYYSISIFAKAIDYISHLSESLLWADVDFFSRSTHLQVWGSYSKDISGIFCKHPSTTSDSAIRFLHYLVFLL